MNINGKIVEINPGTVVPVRSQFFSFFTYTIIVNNGKNKYPIQFFGCYSDAATAKQKMREQVKALRKKHGLL